MAVALLTPVRSIFSKNDNVRFLLGNVTDINQQDKRIIVQSCGSERILDFDYLIVAAGSITNHFGMETIAAHSFGLKDLDDAIALRQHILRLFERAAWHQDAATRDAMTTLVVVGGGPTGLETAGALHELYNHVLKEEYGDSQPRMRARVLLLEASDRLLSPYPENYSKPLTANLKTWVWKSFSMQW
jgi:NADH dehydrogenase